MTPSFRSKSGSQPGGLFPAQAPPDSYLIAHVDGGARGNPGPAGYGVVITDQDGKKVASLSEYLGHQTNNYAEYNGLLAALTMPWNTGLGVEGCRRFGAAGEADSRRIQSQESRRCWNFTSGRKR